MVRQGIRRAVFVLGLLEVVGTFALPDVMPGRAWTTALRTVPAEIDAGLISLLAVGLILVKASAEAASEACADQGDQVAGRAFVAAASDSSGAHHALR